MRLLLLLLAPCWLLGHDVPLAQAVDVTPPVTASSSSGGAASVVNAFFQNSPYTAAAITCGIKASAADLVAQTNNGGGKEKKGVSTALDWKRNLAFIIYGALYQGMTQEWVYNHLYPKLFGSGTSLREVLTKVSTDLFVQTTLITLPIAYITKALVYKYSLGQALRQYKADILNQGLLTKYWCLWGPIQCLTFSVIPEHFRVTFIAFVSFFWLIILSSIANKRG